MDDLYTAVMREADILMGKTVEWMWNNLPNNIAISKMDKSNKAEITFYNWLAQLNYIKPEMTVVVANPWLYIRNRKFFKKSGFKLQLRKNSNNTFFTMEELKNYVIENVEDLSDEKLIEIYKLYYEI